MPPDVPDNMMERLPYYQSKYNTAKKIHVYFVKSKDRHTGKMGYFYAIASSALHDRMMYCLKNDGFIPNFAVIVEQGEGEPTKDIKAKVKAYYGFDHDAAETGASS